MEDKMKCARCSKMVPETTTSSCALGSLEITDYLPQLPKAKQIKLCTFDDQFFCSDCMAGNICQDCAQVLSKDEVEILKQANKI